MAFISVINDSGSVTLDDNYSNFCVAASGSATTAYLGVGDQFDYYGMGGIIAGAGITLSIPDATGLGQYWVAIQCTAFVTVRYQWRTGGVMYFLVASETPVTFKYWIYTTARVLSGNGILQLFNANGEKTFDSDLRYARIVDFVNVFGPPSETPPPYQTNPGWVMPWATTRAFDTSRQYAVVPVEQIEFWDQDGRGSSQAFITCRAVGVRVNNGALTFDYFLARRGTQSSLGDYDSAGNLGSTFMVLDVTGF